MTYQIIPEDYDQETDKIILVNNPAFVQALTELILNHGRFQNE
jgi:hypothetical protein